MKIRTWVVGTLAAAALIAAACGVEGNGDGVTAPQAPSPGLTQRDGGEGGVTVELTWLTAAELARNPDLVDAAVPHDGSSYLLLRVRMDTHSGDLNRYDLLASSELAVDGGQPQAPVAWHPLSDNAHHREVLLVFERPRPGSSVEVALKGLAGVPRRAFHWSPAPPA